MTILGTISIANAGQQDVRMALVAVLGCNLAWGMVDGVMYLVRTLTGRARNIHLARCVQSADAPMRRPGSSCCATPCRKRSPPWQEAMSWKPCGSACWPFLPTR